MSGDETLFAWPDFDGIRTYDRRDGTVRTVDSATWVSGSLVWSPDATKMAMIRVTGDNVAHLEVLDLATDSRRKIFTAEAAKAIRGIRWLSPRVIEFRVLDAADEACCPPQGGARYEVSDVSGHARITGAPNVLWAACGPACGVPPVAYERSDGTVFWYESVPGGTSFHWGVVDRVANAVQILPGAQDADHGALSPDGRTMAYIICNFREPQTLRLVRLSDLTVRDFVPPPIAGGSRVCYNVSWFPSGNRILLHFGVPG